MNQIAATMQRAVAAFQQNDFATAQKLARQALSIQPRNAKIMQVLGIAQSQDGDPVSGFATLKKALQLTPQDAELRFNVAKAALQAGKASEVEALTGPLGEQPAVLHLRALALKETGNLQGSIGLFRKALQQSPHDPQLLNNLGNAYLAIGLADDAIRTLSEARKHDPKLAQIVLNLGRAYTLAEQSDEALGLFREAARLSPSDPEVLLELGKSLTLHSVHDEALPILAEAARQGARDPEVFTLIGTCYAALELRDEAEKAFRMALSIDAKNIRAQLNLGLLLEQDNRVDDLRRLLSSAKDNGFKGGDLDYLQASLMQREGNLENALALAVEARPEFLDSFIHQEFVGKLADRLGQCDLAFQSFQAMNETMALVPNARKFDGTEHSSMIRQRIKMITPEWYESWTEAVPPDERHVPVMLGGFLRSGTTLLDTILMGHPSVQVREEEAMISRIEEGVGDIGNLANLTPAQIGAMRDVYYAELSRGGEVPNDAVLIDKYPLMTVRAAYIHRAFPDAKYIFTLRHPCDVVLSCYMQNFKVTRAMSAFLRLETAAQFYDVVMQHWEQARKVLPLNVHTIRYEDMVEDLEGELRPLIDFIGVDWDDSLLDHQKTAKDRGYIRTPSYAQVTEKVYSRSSGRWTKYREQLAPILPVLAPWVERFGYEPLDL